MWEHFAALGLRRGRILISASAVPCFRWRVWWIARTNWRTDLPPEFIQCGQADQRIYCQNSHSTAKLTYWSTARIHTVRTSWPTDLLPEFTQCGQADVPIYSTARIHTVRTSWQRIYCQTVRIYCQNSVRTSWRTDLLPEFIQCGQDDVRIYCQNSDTIQLFSTDKLTYGSTPRIHLTVKLT